MPDNLQLDDGLHAAGVLFGDEGWRGDEVWVIMHFEYMILIVYS